MKKLLFIFSTIWAISVSGQTSVYHPFPDSNAIWCNAYKNYSNLSVSCCGLIGDTIFDALQYHKLYSLHDSVLTVSGATYCGALRETGKRIYFRNYYCSYDMLLYDFNKMIGDTIFNIVSEHEILYCDSVSGFFAIVTSIDSIIINGTYRKVINNNLGNGWIEGIGSTSGLFNPMKPPIAKKSWYDWYLVCFLLNNEVLYHNPDFGSCFKSYSDIEELSKTENINIKVFPNPSNGSFTVDFDNFLNVREILLRDLLGKIVFQQSINKQNKINIDNLPSGAYILTIIDNDNMKINKKIISSP